MQRLRPLSDSALNFESNIALARSKRARIAASPLIDRILEGSNGSDPLGARAVMSMPIVAYPAADSAIGDVIEYSSRPFRYCLDTRMFRGERGIALVFGDFEMRQEGQWKVFLPRGLAPVEGFPQESSWCGIDAASGVPTLSDLSRKRFAMRLSTPWIGPVIRQYGHAGRAKTDIFLHHRPSHLAVALVDPHLRLEIPPDK